jgi:hypothetical protein
MFRGISPPVLLSQVRNTAAWALDGPAEGAANSWRAALLRAPETPQEYDPAWAYFRLLLAAHFVTVGTFVPTDVDSHIRHHAWLRAGTRDMLSAALDVLDETDAWRVDDVSARVVNVPGVGAISGHDGEWMAVRAGALGRALAMNDEAAIERVSARLDAAVALHAQAFEAVRAARGRELDALCVVATLAHNLGDLSRVVEEWAAKSPRALELKLRYGRLGHDDAAVADPRFLLAGRVNKAVMASENHRFLAMRAARSLRVGRELLLPIGPFFDAWGETLGRSALLASNGPGASLGGRAAAVEALVETHLQSPTQQGVLRALAGFHRAHPGGLDAVAGDVAARLRKQLKAGPIREALGVDRGRFDARMVNRYKAALEGRGLSA